MSDHPNPIVAARLRQQSAEPWTYIDGDHGLVLTWRSPEHHDDWGWELAIDAPDGEGVPTRTFIGGLGGRELGPEDMDRAIAGAKRYLRGQDYRDRRFPRTDRR